MEQTCLELPGNPTWEDIETALSTFSLLTSHEKGLITEAVERWLHREGATTTSITSVVIEGLRDKIDGVKIDGRQLIFACHGGKLSLIALS
ncbi:MAG: hypothetical protein COV91_01990 [Candidatus Taylorbacteria bacterium CG11_big_fil_rev_8_21_14_0_20_46_11]|uniref:Uncharacterized protein n=1 Tax=Candidatus Taylorbacteria bacterium CG11_big_fil_rev_8_21_14_0_20_46_11 TaxID=1975025 RepID=A0A2H0KC78_9BACT|nr:MAG: hypothetical protein COV91_01990 [Candidatus Taylorbacteria bacterium CG11_big_fil_rev_8_21_14_0_20_46_11]